MPVSVHAAYDERLRAGEIAPDTAQARGVDALSRLEGELNALAEPGFSLPFLSANRRGASTSTGRSDGASPC
jgi:predicted ATPase